MEVDVELQALLTERVTELGPDSLANTKNQPRVRQALKNVIDELGKASAKAQGLPSIITTFNRFINSNNKLFLLKEENGMVVGFLKVGLKDLFIHNETEQLLKVRPLCILDFFVHQDWQRRGFGKELFDRMLQRCHQPIKPKHIAYDRPSAKLLSFLKKHFDLSSSLTQFNKFFIPSGFFEANPCLDDSQFGHKAFYPYGGFKSGLKSCAKPNSTLKKWFSEDADMFSKRLADLNVRPHSAQSLGVEEANIPVPVGRRVHFSRHLTGQESPRDVEAIHMVKNENQNNGNFKPVLKDMVCEKETETNYNGVDMTCNAETLLKDNHEPISEYEAEDHTVNPSPFSPRIKEFDSESRKLSQMSWKGGYSEKYLGRDWTTNPRMPIGSEISSKGVVRDGESQGSVSKSFIWLPASKQSDHHVRAPYATLKQSSTDSQSTSTISSEFPRGNKRFQRTSLW